MNHPESTIQRAIIQWWALAHRGLGVPDANLLYAIPNGGSRVKKKNRHGDWYSPEAARMKAEGVRAGIPDLFLAVPRGVHFGLYIELKAPNGRISEAQQGVITSLRHHGYYVDVCWSFDEARERIEGYLKLPKPDAMSLGKDGL